MREKILALAATIFLLTPMAFADDGTSGITAPITKIATLVKDIVSVLGVIAITVAGAMYMFSGSNIQSRESAKSMVTYAIIGLVLVWVAPLVVNYLTAPTGA